MVNYVILLAILGVNFIIAYKFRRYNDTSHKFFFNNDSYLNFSGIFDDLGIIEIMLFSMGSSYLGINILYSLLIGIIINKIIEILLIKKIKKKEINSFNEYILLRFNKPISIAFSIFCSGFLLFLLGLALSLLFKCLHSFLGYGFINYTMAALGFCAIIMLIGGKIADCYIKTLNSIVIICVITYIIFMAIPNMHAIINIADKLKITGKENFAQLYYYFSIVNVKQLSLLILILIGFISVKILLLQINNKKTVFNQPLKLIILITLIIPGIVVIAPNDVTSLKKINIETIPITFSNGDFGYKIRAATKKNSHTYSQGLLPPYLDTQNGKIKLGSYNHESAVVIFFDHYLPKKIKLFSLIILLLAFMTTCKKYLFKLTEITLYNILIPLNFTQKYGKIGELWAIQTFLISFVGITFIATYIMLLYYNLLNILLYGVLLFSIPIVTIILFSLILPQRSNYGQKK